MYRLLGLAFSFIAAMGLLAWAVAPREEAGAGAEQPAAAQTGPVSHFNDDPRVMRLARDSSGQFHLTAQVNGQDTRFLVDTGADLVALTENDAEELGFNVPEGDFQPIMQTASGVGYGAPVMIDELTLGESTYRDVEAVVVRDLAVNLLGQSVLRRFARVELKGDQLVIRH
jgi:aspartyl protease family protein